MVVNLGKFVHTETGKMIMSILLGLGLASLFRNVCKNKNCMIFHAPPLENFKDKIFKSNGKCVKYVPISTKCISNTKTVDFE
jgi:hypothetical protein